MSTNKKKPEEKNPQLFYNVKIFRIKKMYRLLDKIRRAQLGTDKESRLEYRMMEQELLKHIEKEKLEAIEMQKAYKINHSPKDLIKNA